jgi:excisionase family DNA binding protein
MSEPTAATMNRRGYSPRELAEVLRTGRDRIVSMIRRGELRALNMGPGPRGRPRFVIMPEMLQEFLNRRQVVPAVKKPKRRRQAAQVDYFPD